MCGPRFRTYRMDRTIDKEFLFLLFMVRSHRFCCCCRKSLFRRTNERPPFLLCRSVSQSIASWLIGFLMQSFLAWMDGWMGACCSIKWTGFGIFAIAFCFCFCFCYALIWLINSEGKRRAIFVFLSWCLCCSTRLTKFSVLGRVHKGNRALAKATCSIAHTRKKDELPVQGRRRISASAPFCFPIVRVNKRTRENLHTWPLFWHRLHLSTHWHCPTQRKVRYAFIHKMFVASGQYLYLLFPPHRRKRRRRREQYLCSPIHCFFSHPFLVKKGLSATHLWLPGQISIFA